MAINDDVCKVIIENVELLEAAPLIVDEIEKKIFKAIDQKFEEMYGSREGWKGIFTYHEDADDAETTFAPHDWPENEEGEYKAYFSFSHNDEEMEYYLTALMGKHPQAAFGIYFCVDYGYFGLKKAQWKTLLAKEYYDTKEIQDAVVLDEDTLFIPVTLDDRQVSEEYPDFDQSLKPLQTALHHLSRITPYVDTIVKKLKAQVVR